MSRVPITVMGFRCERCSHEWIPRGGIEDEPRVCPACKSPYWNKPRKSATTYEAFAKAIESTLKKAGKPLTWTEVRTLSSLPQALPNNKWVRQLETDIGLVRKRDEHGIIHWHLGASADTPPDEIAEPKRAAKSRKQGSVE